MNPDPVLLSVAAEYIRSLPNKFVTITNTTATDLLSIVANEAPTTRVAWNPGSSAYDGAQTRQEIIETPAVFLATTALTYQRVALLVGSVATASIAVSAIDATANTLTFASAPGLANGDRVVVTADAGGTVPAALLNSGAPRFLFVVGASGNSIQLALTQGGAEIDFGTGTLPIRVRTARADNGFAIGGTEASPVTIPAGGSRTMRIGINFGGPTANLTAT